VSTSPAVLVQSHRTSCAPQTFAVCCSLMEEHSAHELSPFGTGNETFGLSPVFKQAAAIVGDGTFQSSRRWFLQSTASNFPNLATWSYFWNVSGPGTPAYEGGE
jgi:hypothetical protein